MTDRTLIYLPMPPSSNNMFFNLPSGRGRAKTSEYKAWISIASMKLRAQRPLSFADDVEVHYRLGPRNRSADVENRIKPISDLLTKNGIIKDDRFIVKYVVEWAGDVRGVEVTVQGIQGELRPSSARRARLAKAKAKAEAGAA